MKYPFRKSKDSYLKVKAHYDSGVTFLERGRYADAIFQFEKAVALDPNYVGGMYYLAYCLHRTGQLDEARYWAERVMAARPDDSETYYLLGSIYSDRGEFEQALQSYQAALRTNDDSNKIPMINMALAYIYAQLAMREEAIQAYKEILKIEPNRDDVRALIGGVYLEQGDFKQAIKHLEKGNSIDSSVQQSLAWALWHINKRERAISILRNAAELFPNDGQLYSLLGSFLFQAKRFDEAVEVLEKASNLSKEPGEETYLLGSALCETGFLDRALEAYQTLLERSPNDALLLTAIGYVYLKQDKLEKALGFWREAVGVAPMDAATRSDLAYGLYLKGDLETALDEVDQAIAIDADDDVAHQRKGYILKALGDMHSSAREFEKAVDLGQPEALLDLADLYRESGNVSQARGYVEQFIKEANKEETDDLVNLANYLEEAQAMLRELE